jgi:hypothetical protein
MIARTVALVLVLGCHVQHASAPATPPPPPPPLEAHASTAHAEWSVGLVEDNRIGLRELVWLEDGTHVTWHRRPPGRVARISMCCWSDDARIRRTFDFLAPTVLDADEIVVQQERQLWVLSRRDGSTKYDWSDNRTNLQRGFGALIDAGTIEIRIAAQTCTSTFEGQHFARACGHFLVYFDDGLFELFDRTPYQRIAQTIVTDAHDRTCQSHAVERTFKLGAADVRLVGRRIVECIR